MKATQGHRATPAAPTLPTLVTVPSEMTVGWTAAVNPDSWDVRLIDATSGQVAAASEIPAARTHLFTGVMSDEHFYYGLVRANTAGEPGPWAITPTVQYSA